MRLPSAAVVGVLVVTILIQGIVILRQRNRVFRLQAESVERTKFCFQYRSHVSTTRWELETHDPDDPQYKYLEGRFEIWLLQPFRDLCHVPAEFSEYYKRSRCHVLDRDYQSCLASTLKKLEQMIPL